MSKWPLKFWTCLPVATVAAMLMLSLLPGSVWADVRMPAIFSDHMVLQRDLANPVWGWADVGEEVVVVMGDQKKTAKADAQGKWRIVLDPVPVGGPHKIVIEGQNRVAIEDVLVGEVWVCSGQSNMQQAVNSTKDADLTKCTAHYPNLRVIAVPVRGTQEPQDDFKGAWQPTTPETVGGFTAAGYFFALTLHQALGIPIGLIHDSWGGSACEAWVPRELFEADPQYKPLMDRWREIEQKKSDENLLNGNARPGNLFNGMLKPVIGYGIRGAIWYQGESNAGRAYQYRHMFPLMIKSWRDAWQQGDFSFYWVQLADFTAEPAAPGDSDWAELREAQTMTQSLPKTGQAVIIDIGEANDIHPRNKEDVGERLARWALAKDYGVDIVCRSAEYKSMEIQGNKIVISLDYVAGELKPFDINEIRGFTIAGEDHKFVPAQAKVVDSDKTKVEVWSDQVGNPVAVRYAWANNPVCNLRSSANLLPVTPFRTDDWPGVTANAK